MPSSVTANVILTGIAAALSLVFAYLPGLKTLYDRLDSQVKPLVQLAIIALTVFGYLAYACRFQGACIAAGLPAAFQLFIACITANQVTYLVGVRQIKSAAKPVARNIWTIPAGPSDPPPPDQTPIPPAPPETKA